MRIQVLVFFIIASLAAPAFSQGSGPTSPHVPQPAGPSVDDSSSTGLVCYFKDGAGNTTWRWGLSAGDQWYVLSGEWIKTPYTKHEKFVTMTTEGPMNEACRRSKEYYELSGYSLFAYFAASNSMGSNYSIVSCGTELFPLD